MGESGWFLSRREPLGLEAPHLARRRCAIRSCLAADDPAHRGIIAQALGVVNIFIPSEPTEHRLSQQTDESMPAVLARARVGEHLARCRGEAEPVVEFPIGEQSRVGGDGCGVYYFAAVKRTAGSVVHFE